MRSSTSAAGDGWLVEHHETGTEVETAPLDGSTVWLRLQADIRPGSGRTGTFSHSLDGENLTPLVGPYTMNSTWEFFMGYRYAIFNHAAISPLGSDTVRSFEITPL